MEETVKVYENNRNPILPADCLISDVEGHRMSDYADFSTGVTRAEIETLGSGIIKIYLDEEKKVPIAEMQLSPGLNKFILQKPVQGKGSLMLEIVSAGRDLQLKTLKFE